MAPSATTPLLADSRRLSEQSDRRAEEEDAALHDTELPPPPANRSAKLREILLFLWALLATAIVIVLAVYIQHRNDTPRDDPPPSANRTAGKRNLIFMVSDGMGPASLSLTRSFRQFAGDLPIDDTLTLDRHFWGTSRTRSSSKLVTDSAAGATAFSCGKKSYNGAISMLPDFTPCGTVLEAAKQAGYMTGLVVTTEVTDATPACFASHVYLREQEDEIALQEIGEGVLGRSVDLILGGGRCRFLPNTTVGSCREDDVDVTALAQKKHGWSYVDNRAGFDAMRGGKNVSLPALGLFASTDIPFEVDRRNMADVYPSLSEMAKTALQALSDATKDSEKGFFLMIEGSRIDHAGHANDPAAQVREVLEFDKTFQSVLDFIEESDVEGVLVSTSDHETGGLVTAWQSSLKPLPVYNWYPAVLARANASAERLAHLLRQYLRDTPSTTVEALKEWINVQLLVKHLGITNALDTELADLAALPSNLTWHFSRLISRRAHVGWTTHGHSAVDVNIYSSGGPGTEKIRGNVENTEIGDFLREYLSVDVDKVTEELQSKMDAQGVSDELRTRIEGIEKDDMWLSAELAHELGLEELPAIAAAV